MSFILDALKKAEAERHRRVAPVLVDARVAPPRRGLPTWAWALGVVLLVNLVVLAWLLLRVPSAPVQQVAGVPQAGAPPAAAQPADAPAAAATAPQPGASPATVAPPSPALAQAGLPVAPVRATPPPVTVPRIDDSDRLPALHELRAAGVSLPELVLNLHVYDPAPAHRSVMLNGIRLREGEYTPNGVKVERITPAGVVLEAAGRRFRLDAGG